MDITRIGTAPGMPDFVVHAWNVIHALPEVFRERLEGLVLRVEEYADDNVLDDLDIEDPLELTGLYLGTPLTEAEPTMTASEPPRVFLYRMPILFEWASSPGITLDELIAHVTIHEIGHHFGWSDDQMDAVLDMLNPPQR